MPFVKSPGPTGRIRRVLIALCGAAALVSAAWAGDILRGGAPMAGTRTHAQAGGNAGTAAAGRLDSNAKDRLARTTAAINAVRAMQLSAREAAAGRIKSPTGRGILPRVPEGLTPGGLEIAPGVPKDLNKPKAGENPSLWIGASLPKQTRGKDGSRNVTIVQTEQQALLNWTTFNVGKKTSLYFDQTEGGKDAGKWIAFNKVSDPKARPSQILGSIKAEGQVYVINQNGIIFGGSSQVNTHTLVASGLTINDNLIGSGLLDNPNAEFLFNNARTEDFTASALASQDLVLADIRDDRSGVKLSATVTTIDGSGTNTGTFLLVEGRDYKLKTDRDRRTAVFLTNAGKNKLFGKGDPGVTVTLNSLVADYATPAGDVIVEPGAMLASPKSADNVGGRIMLVGANVENRGTISTPNGQTILAAGLQVGIDGHKTSDSTIRGLDVYVGKVFDPDAQRTDYAGTATNSGFIDVPRGNALITGQDVNQFGAIDSTTSVDFNGSVTLAANYDAVSNTSYDAADPAKGAVFNYQSTGLVTLGGDSVTRILPEYDSDKTVTDALKLRSKITLQGHNILFDAGAVMLAPNGEINATAGKWFYQPPSGGNAAPTTSFVFTDGQIYLDKDVLVDVAGTTAVSTALDEFVTKVQLRGAELADSPLQRDGILRFTDEHDTELTVDLRRAGFYRGRFWLGTPLADITGLLNLLEHTVAELTMDGGSVSLQAGNSIVLQKGSVVDVSGGWQRVAGGFVETTRVMSGGQLIDIADATPDLVYDGIYTPKFTTTQEKWGVTRTYSHPLTLTGRHYENSYIQGHDGGSISITAPSMALDGRLAGNTAFGTRQLRNSNDASDIPAPSRLSLAFESQTPSQIDPATFLPISPTAPRVVFGGFSDQAAAEPFAVDEFGDSIPLDEDRRKLVVLSPDLVNKDGFGMLSINNSGGRIAIPEGIHLKFRPGAPTDPAVSTLDLKALSLTIGGAIVAPGGRLKFTVYNVSPYEFISLSEKQSAGTTILTPDPNPKRGVFVLAPSAVLSTAGLQVDDRFTADDPLVDPLVMGGGSVDVNAMTIRLTRGSVIDVSGGARFTTAGKVSYGDAGSISLLAGRDPGWSSLLGGGLILHGALWGLAGEGKAGGSLSLQAPLVRISNSPASSGKGFTVTPDFFNQGGFAKFSLAGIGAHPFAFSPFLNGGAPDSLAEMLTPAPVNATAAGVKIDPGVVIDPVVRNWIAKSVFESPDQLSLDTILLEPSLRPPVSLSFNAVGVTDFFSNEILFRGDVRMGEGAVIRAGAEGSVTLKGDTVSVLGSVFAPGGSITVQGGNAFKDRSGLVAKNPRTTVYFGPESVLDASGATVLVPDDFDFRRGVVLPGGKISISGNIVAERTALLDVSGTSGILDLTPGEAGLSSIVPVNSGLNSPLFLLRSVPVRLDSDGGVIELKGGEQLYVDAALHGAAGGPSALGGTLLVSSGRFIEQNTIGTPKDINLVVRQSGVTIPSPDDNAPHLGIGRQVLGRDGKPMTGRGYFTVDSFTTGGFDSLELGGVVAFNGSVDIGARQQLSIADGGFIYANDSVVLTAPYVKLGQDFKGPLLDIDPDLSQPFGLVGGAPFHALPRYGDGTLTVNALLVDIGNLSLQNIGLARFFVDGGDIRGDGTFNIAGRLYVQAGQIYPATGVAFTLAAYDYKVDAAGKQPAAKGGKEPRQGVITIIGSGSRQLPLSAGGTLNVYASQIRQGGVLRAPLGSINLGWDGTGDAPVDPITGRAFAVANRLSLLGGSQTSVSAVDPATGADVIIPYGLVINGTSWFDPSGFDITGGGVSAKDIQLNAKSVLTRRGSQIDIAGGGDLFAYQWIEGQGGSQDVLASEDSFAVIPGYQPDYMPYAPFNQKADVVANFGTDRGYVNDELHVGDRVYLNGGSGLSAGAYTLLPARYALLPGAVLVTPQSGAVGDSVALPDGSSIVSGYFYNGLDSSRQRPSDYASFEIAPSSVVRARSEYDGFSANRFLLGSARRLGVDIPRLPKDSGHLVFEAAEEMSLKGAVSAKPAEKGIGAYIDISSPVDIVISGSPGKVRRAAGEPSPLVLNASDLSGFDAESLLIGGIRTTGEDGTAVDVKTGTITVDNDGSPLAGPEIILVANKGLELAPRAEIEQQGEMVATAQKLLLDGDGVLLRVSSDPGAGIVRSGVDSTASAGMTIGKNARITGTSLILDSSHATSLSPQADLDAGYISLNSGQISLRLAGAGKLQPTDGLVLAGSALGDLKGVQSLSLLSYTTIDIYGAGRFAVDGSLSLHAGGIRGFNASGREVTFAADEITLDNSARAPRPASTAPAGGTFALDAGTLFLGKGSVDITQYGKVELSATDHVEFQRTGRLLVNADLSISAPYIDAEDSSKHRVLASGALSLLNPFGAPDAFVSPGLGASLSFKGTTILANTDIYLPSGFLDMRATAGDVTVGGRLYVGGSENVFYDLVKYTGGGQINLSASAGSVNVTKTGMLSVAAAKGGGDAGLISVSTPNGRFALDGTLLGSGSEDGRSGSFVLDVGSASGFSGINEKLDDGNFTESRKIRVRSGDVTIADDVRAHEFWIFADKGSITLEGTIDASGMFGGDIELVASGGLTMKSGSGLDVSAKEFNAAGKGGSILLEAGAQTNGVVDATALLDLQEGATIDLGVGANNPTSAESGLFTGTLHLRAPQIATNDDLQAAPIDATIRGASSIVVEGYQLFDLTAAGGNISTSVKNSVRTNGNLFMGAGYDAMHDRLLANNPGLENVLSIRPGAEVINLAGDLTLGASNTNGSTDWNFDAVRFGPKNAPGILTMRAAGDLVFNNGLQDGFNIGANTGNAFTAPLLASNPLLPMNAQSWSFRLAAGSDLGAASFRSVLPTRALAVDKGSLLLGKNATTATAGAGRDGLTRNALGTGGRFYQVIRTGSGDIDIVTGRDVRFRNQFATIYTAGTLIDDPTMKGEFDLPVLNDAGSDVDILGGSQQRYPVQYSMAGGDVSIDAAGSIYHVTRLNADIADREDSSRQLPVNWLLRRGYIDPLTGEFGTSVIQSPTTGEDVATISSTTWWVNFSNFFEGVAALGGGNVTLTAGDDVRNVDAASVTNARMPKGRPDVSKLVELGGGDVTVQAGRDISGGVYYVERGNLALSAGRDVTTNATRSPSLTILNTDSATGLPEGPRDPSTWLPTTIFLGKGSASVNALGNVLLGPVVNPFLLPGGFTNTYRYKTYFSSYSPGTSVDVTSRGGSIVVRQAAVSRNDAGSTPILLMWLKNVNQLNDSNAAFYHPWIRLNEENLDSFYTAASLLPPSVKFTAFAGDINLIGNLTLAPASKGTLDLVAGGAINGLQLAGIRGVQNRDTGAWGYSTINVSDGSPSALPRIAAPFSVRSVGLVGSDADFLAFFDNLFKETGATDTVLQIKQTLHGEGPLHAEDAQPVHVYAAGGDISGLTLFSPKATRVVASNDITDVALYMQNISDDDISVVSAGRDIVAYNANSPLRTAATAEGNLLNDGSDPRAGDIQLGGPGTLEVLAGRNLDLGIGESNPDGTATGITTIGNRRNPFLPFDGASIVTGAGIGPSFGLSSSKLDFDTFVDDVLADSDPAVFAEALGLFKDTDGVSVDGFDLLESLEDAPDEKKAAFLLNVFYIALRDAGRDHNLNGTNYETGFAAIDALFGKHGWRGDIDARARDIRTKNGGDISIFAPGGALKLSRVEIGNPAVPPGIITETGGNISIFTDDDVDIGIGRIFTLRGGNEIIWSSTGDIAAGSAAKTVASAPPTRVLLDPQSADVETDLAGLSTGGGIGVLATVEGVPPGDVDLIAPAGIVDAGDAGIRVSGNLNIAATKVLNASNIAVQGSSIGVPAPAPVAAPNVSGLTSASNTAGAANSAAESVASQARQQPQAEEQPSLISAQVIGYGGGEGGPAPEAAPQSREAAPSDAGGGDDDNDRDRNGGMDVPPVGA